MRLTPKIISTIIPIILIQIIVLSIPSFLIYRNFFADQMRENISDSIDQAQNTLDTHLKNLTADSALFSKSIILERYLRTLDEDIRFNVMHKVLLNEFISFRSAHPEYTEISLIMPDGYEEVSLVDGAINLTDEEQDTFYFKNIVASLFSFEILVSTNPDDGKWVLILARKIFQRQLAEQSSSTKPTLKGYLVIKTNFNFMYSILESKSLGERGIAMLHTGSGTPIIKKEGDELIYSALSEILSETTHTNKEEILKQSFDGDSYIIGKKELTNGLFITIGWPESELNQLLKNMSYTTIVVTLLVMSLSALIFIWLLHRFLVKPILQLGNSAKEMGQGNSQWSFPSKSNDELNDLAETIRIMGQNLIEEKQKVHNIAYQDSLTLLPNRRQFLDELNLIYSANDSYLPHAALLFIDLDGFKQVNDFGGHEIGDQVLVAVAGRLKNILRTGDIFGYATPASVHHNIARLGGDEFTVLLKGIDGRDVAAHVAERILKSFQDNIHIDNHEYVIGASIGISLSTESGESAGDLLKNADYAMYEAKRQGKNTYRFFSRSAALESLKSMEIKDDLRRAIDANELKLAYQPQISADTGEIVGCEALVRWKQKDKGWISPEVFIPIAEASGLIIPLGRWVLLEACHQIKQWQLMGYKKVSVSVNLSNVQLARENIPQLVQDCLAETGLSAEYLTLEVTESSIMQGQDSINQLERIQADGICVALDDFGTGYSSLSALRGLPINELKIDKSFISDISGSKEGKTIVSAIIAMAHQLDLKVVAEGVETKEELDYLKRTRGNIIQGYYFSKPLMGSELTNFLSPQFVSEETRKQQVLK